MNIHSCHCRGVLPLGLSNYQKGPCAAVNSKCNDSLLDTPCCSCSHYIHFQHAGLVYSLGLSGQFSMVLAAVQSTHLSIWTAVVYKQVSWKPCQDMQCWISEKMQPIWSSQVELYLLKAMRNLFTLTFHSETTYHVFPWWLSHIMKNRELELGGKHGLKIWCAMPCCSR